MPDISEIARRSHDTGFEQGSIAAANAILSYLGKFGPHTATMLKTAWEAGRVAEEAGLSLSGPSGVPSADPVTPPPSILLAPPKITREQARGSGYTGDACTNCQGMQVKRNGSCLVCEACGTTTGCS